jgi:hypothetical protein
VLGAKALYRVAPARPRCAASPPRDGPLASDDDRRRPLAELTAHRELWSTGGDDRQRTSDVARRQLTEAETFGAREVVREDVIVRAAREDPSTTAA